MEYTSYMTPNGDWAGNFYGDTPVPEGLEQAPHGGRYGVRWDGAAWVADGASEARADAFMAGPDAVLQAERAAMRCARWQMILALGEVRWQAVDAFAKGPAAPWGLRVVIDNAVEISRLSETVETLALVLGLSAAEVDDLFRSAMALRA
jgi:hypothetical protein